MGDQYYEMVSNLSSPSKLQRTRAKEWLDTGPRLSPSEEWYVLAFDELAFDRPPNPMGGGYFAIPWTTFHAYANHLNLDETKRDIFLTIMRAIDTAERVIANRG